MPATASTPPRRWQNAVRSMRWSSNAWPSAPSRWRSCAASREPAHGYDPLLQARLRAVLPACVRNGVKIISNMGAAHPEAAGAAVLAVARELGLQRLRVAVVTGDDVLPWVQAHDVALLDSTQRASDLGERLVSANAYLGADALLPALASGADVVITGRVADPALFLAPLMHAFGWRGDDWPQLGQGVLVGHLLECAAQVSGGYIADPGHFDVPDLHDVGFPLAEVQADGTAVITKLAGTGGCVNRLTCTRATAVRDRGPGALPAARRGGRLFAGAFAARSAPTACWPAVPAGTARPEQLKATLGYRDGWIGEGQISYAGPGARERGALALQVLQQRMRVRGFEALEQRAELIGVDAMHGPQLGGDRSPYEVRARLAVRCSTREQAEQRGPGSGGAVPQRPGRRRWRHAVGARGHRRRVGAGAARGGAHGGADPGAVT